jgi:RNA polymerase sigma factor (sigma-70 family)
MNPTPLLRHEQLENAARRYMQGRREAETAAKELFGLLWPGFVRFFVQQGMDAAQAEDLASETMFKVFKNVDQLNSAVSFQKWANTIARNTLLTHLRDTQAMRSAQWSAADDEQWSAVVLNVPDAGQGDPVTRLCLEGQLGRFAQEQPERAKVLELAALEGWSIDEAATALGRTLGATRQYLSQCRKQLWRYLSVCLDNSLDTTKVRP